MGCEDHYRRAKSKAKSKKWERVRLTIYGKDVELLVKTSCLGLSAEAAETAEKAPLQC